MKLQFSVSPSNGYSGLISLRMDWFDVQRTLKCLLQHHSSKASSLRCSAFFMVQLSHPYMTTGKTTALTLWTFVAKVMSLLFNTLSRLVIAFLARSRRLFISWLQSSSSVILEPKKIKCHCFHFSPCPSSCSLIRVVIPASTGCSGLSDIVQQPQGQQPPFREEALPRTLGRPRVGDQHSTLGPSGFSPAASLCSAASPHGSNPESSFPVRPDLRATEDQPPAG